MATQWASTSAYVLGTYVYNPTNPTTRYPTTNMTTNTFTSTEGQYIASASSTYADGWDSSQPYRLFGEAAADPVLGWISPNGKYNGGPYSASVTSTVSGTSYSGEYVQLQCPISFALTWYKLAIEPTYADRTWFDPVGRAPNSWVIAGSTDNITWTFLDAKAGQTWTANETKTFSINNSVPYRYYKLIVRSVVNGNGSGLLTLRRFLLYTSDSTPNYYASAAIPTNTVITDSRWLDLSSFGTWNSTTSYAPGSTVAQSNKLYNLWSQTSLNQSPASNSAIWFPFYDKSIAYSQKSRVYMTSTLVAYMAYSSSVTAGTTPTAPNTTGNGWVPYYTAALGSVLTGHYVVHDANTLALPPGNMTAATTTLGGNSYVASASSTSNASTQDGWVAFDGTTTSQWVSSTGRYNATTGFYTGSTTTTVNNGSPVAGEWVQIQLPAALTPTGFTASPSTLLKDGRPALMTVLGSNDGTTWVNLSGSQLPVAAVGSPLAFGLRAASAYSYFRFVVNSINQVNGSGAGGIGTYATIYELKLFGSIRASSAFSQLATMFIARNLINSNTNTTAAPLAMNTSGNGWVPVYQSGSGFVRGSWTYDTSSAQYFFAYGDTTLTTAPSNLVGNSTGWLPIYKAGSAYASGHFVMGSDSVTPFVARDNTNLGTAPAIVNTANTGWCALSPRPLAVRNDYSLITVQDITTAFGLNSQPVNFMTLFQYLMPNMVTMPTDLASFRNLRAPIFHFDAMSYNYIASSSGVNITASWPSTNSLLSALSAAPATTGSQVPVAVLDSTTGKPAVRIIRGNGQYHSVTNAMHWDLSDGYTLIWVGKTGATTENDRFFDCSTANLNNVLAFMRNGDGTLLFETYTTNNTTQNVSLTFSGIPTLNNKISCIALVVRPAAGTGAGRLFTFIDGTDTTAILRATQNFNNLNNALQSNLPVNQCWIGRSSFLAQGTSTIDSNELMAWNTALSDEAVTDTMNHLYAKWFTPLARNVATVSWIASIRGTGDERALGMAALTDGGFVVVGRYSSTLTANSSSNVGYATTLATSSGIDGFAVKYLPNGEVAWVARLLSSGEERAMRVCPGPGGGFTIIGYTSGSINLYNANSSTSTTLTTSAAHFVVSYSAAGVVQWVACFTGAAAPDADDGINAGIDSTIDGGVVVCGNFSSTLKGFSAGVTNTTTGTAFGTLSIGSGAFDGYVARLSSNGTIEWMARLVCDEVRHVAEMPDGSIVVAGGNSGTGTAYSSNGNAFATNIVSSGNNDPYVVKYSSTGTVQWVTKFTATSFDSGDRIAATTGGLVVIASVVYSSDFSPWSWNGSSFTAFAGTLMPTNNVPPACYIAVYNGSGVVQYVCKVDGTGQQEPTCLLATPDGGFVFGGWFSSTSTMTAYSSDGKAFGTTFNASAGGNDSFLVKYNAAGIVQWVTRMAGTASDNVRDMAILMDGSMVACGYYGAATLSFWNASEPTGTAFATTLSNSGATDAFIVRYLPDFAVASPPVPLQFGNCGLWLDASDSSTLTMSGGLVSQWNDKSGFARHFTQSDATYRPAYEASGFNGRPSLSLNSLAGATRYMSRNANQMGTLASGAAITLFVVAEVSTTTWSNVFSNWTTATGSADVQRFRLSHKDSVAPTHALYVQGANRVPTSGVTPLQSSRYVSTFTYTQNLPSFMGLNGTDIRYVPSTALPSSAASSTSAFVVGEASRAAGAPTGCRRIAELIMYDRALNTSERRTIEAYLAAKYGLTAVGGPTFTPQVLDPLSASAKSALQGAYSTRRLLTTYNGPVIRVRRSIDNVEADFYEDPGRSLSTSASGGTSLSSWLSVSTAFVTRWYDQSGNGRDASQTNVSLQPTISPDMPGIVNFTYADANGRWLTLPDGTVPSGNSAFTVTCRHGVINKTNGGWLGSGAYGTVNGVNAFRRTGSPEANDTSTDVSNSYHNYWWGQGVFSRPGYYAPGNVVTFTYDGTTLANGSVFVNGTNLVNEIFSGTTSAARNSTTTNCTIGVTNSTEYLNGELNYLYIFNAVLTAADMAVVEAPQVNQWVRVSELVASTAGPFTWSHADIATALGLSSLTNLTYRAVTVLRSSSDPDTKTLTLDPSSYKGRTTSGGLALAEFGTMSFNANNDSMQMVIVANASGTFSLASYTNYGATKTQATVNQTGISAYAASVAGSGLNLGLYVQLSLPYPIDYAPTALAGAQTYTPPQSGLGLWLDASDPLTVTTSSGKITQWSDKSGQGRHFAQATDAKRPNYEATGFNGMGCMVIPPNSTRCLTRLANLMGTLASSTTVSMFFVTESSYTADATHPESVVLCNLFDEAYNWDGIGRFAVSHFKNSTTKKLQLLATSSLRSILGPDTAIATKYVNGVVYGGSNVTSYLSVNGSVTSFTDPMTLPSSQGSATSAFILGDARSAGTYFSCAKIAEVIMYDRAVTVSERTSIETYLMNKYSL